MKILKIIITLIFYLFVAISLFCIVFLSNLIIYWVFLLLQLINIIFNELISTYI